MFKYIIFDWSGVIKDALADHLVVVNKIFKKFGAKSITLEELRKNWCQPYMLFYNQYLPNLKSVEQAIAYKEAILESPKASEFPGIVSLIKKFKKAGIRMAVLSSDLPETFYPEIKNFGLEGIFDDLMINVEDKIIAIKDLIEKNKFVLSNTCIIGDSQHEIKTGKTADIKTIAVTWGFCPKERLVEESPDFIVNNIQELEFVIFSKNA